jgi:hypothetical protein
MGYVLVKAPFGEDSNVNVVSGSAGPQVLLTGAGGYDLEGAAKKYGKNAAAAGEPWARLGQMAAIGGGIYGGLNALNESLSSGQGGGLLNDVGMGAYGGYATLSPISNWAGTRGARRFAGKERADEEEKGAASSAEIEAGWLSEEQLQQEAQGHQAEYEALWPKQQQEGMADPTQGQRDRTGALKPQFNIPAGGDMSSFWGPSDQTQREFDNRSRYGYNTPTPQPWNLVPGGYVPPPTGAGTTQMNYFGAPVGAGEGMPPFDPNNPAHQGVAELTPSSVGVKQSGNPDDEMIEGLKQRKIG